MIRGGARETRLPALDAARGVLAMVVVVSHVCVGFGSHALDVAACVAVLLFFAMSGFVLGRAYDGRPMVFMLRRVVRLWPLYAVCLVAGHVAKGSAVPLREFALLWGHNLYLWVDPPAWSLRYEIWAIPLLPAAIVLARRFWWLCLALAVAAVLAVFLVDFRFMFAAAMIAGVAASVQDWRFDIRVGKLALWLGKISYSLYLTHWIVLAAVGQMAGPWAELAALPIVLLVAWAAWWAIERPSITLSRTMDKRFLVLFFKKEQRFL